jgi:hypothetical protein
MSTKIIVPRIIYRSFVQQHPEWIFVYGDNMMGNGMLGQPWHMSGEPNTFSVPTCVKPCRSNRYFSDEQSQYYTDIIYKAFYLIPNDGRPIIVLRRIGEGCSRLSEICPKLFNFLKTCISAVDTINKENNFEIEWDYAAN